VNGRWGCCRFGFEGEIDGCVSGKSWLLLLDVRWKPRDVCVCVCVKGAMTSCLEGSIWIRSGFARGMGVKVGGDEWA
jgi:hypothetical protein